MAVEKSPSEEELVRSFIRMLKKDKEDFPFLIKFIERVVYDTMTLGENDFLPVFAITVSVKREGADKLELNVRPIRTDEPQLFEAFQLEKLATMLNDAFEKYGKEVWGMTPLDVRKESPLKDVMKSWENAVKNSIH